MKQTKTEAKKNEAKLNFTTEHKLKCVQAKAFPFSIRKKNKPKRKKKTFDAA